MCLRRLARNVLLEALDVVLPVIHFEATVELLQDPELRDERVEAFASLLWAGVHEYSYVATATTPGQFVVPPAKAEEMYAPETFGRSGSDRVIVR